MRLPNNLVPRMHRTLAAVGIVIVVGCADGRRERPRSSPVSAAAFDAQQASPTSDAVDLDARNPEGLTDAFSVPEWSEPSKESIYGTLQRESEGEPVALVETATGIAAVTTTGKVVDQLVMAKKVARSSYDVRFGIIWFVRDGSLEALDLRGTQWNAVVVLKQMPPLPPHLFPGTDRLPDDPCGRPCVELTTSPPRFEVHAERNDIVLVTPREELRLRAIAKYKPVLTTTGAAFLSKLENPPIHPQPLPLVLSTSILAQGVPGADGGSAGGCNGTCGRGFLLARFGWSVVSTGRTCECDEDICTPRCALYDPITRRFAPLSRASAWTTQPTRSEVFCDIELDASQVAYRLPDGSRLCTKDSCRQVGGRVFAWLIPGPSVPVQELRESYSDGCGS